MKRVIGVFLLYLLVNVVYLFMVGTQIYDCQTWNQITNMFILIVNIGAIFLSIFVTKDEFETVNKRFLIRMIIGVVYLSILYGVMESQYLMLKC